MVIGPDCHPYVETSEVMTPTCCWNVGGGVLCGRYEADPVHYVWECDEEGEPEKEPPTEDLFDL